MKLKFVFFITLCFFFISCGDDNGTNPDNSGKEIWPLAVGNSWTYYVYSYSKSDSTLGEASDSMNYKVSSKLRVDGEDWYVISNNGEAILVGQNRKNGFWGYSFDEFMKSKKDTAAMRFNYPTYVNEHSVKKNNDLITLSTDTVIKSAVGTFNCITYADYGKSFKNTSTNYVAPGIGLVRFEVITMITDWEEFPDTIWIRMELVRYNIKK
jgi:hypothetical protein